MRHTISVLVENKFGVLARIAGLFSARGFNIDSLAVGETQDPAVSCMTIVVNAEDERILEQIKKQLHKLIDIITVIDLTKKEFFERELVLVKVSLDKSNKANLEKIAHKFNAEILHSDKESAIIEAALEEKNIEEFLSVLKEFGIKQLVRTGKIAIPK
ncbi:MAG: acetolactate synthase small subunit [Candidatus Omnitrophica bacterium]|nr:acetolactate synthase small subunit [Candidatus Omnitrophota bacterium]MDD5351818.1 acetolactate synthase small subunit [Candidatus Omnitrophota bacterium]MDD5550644.1 acetolactate synthase small subunit [Candidatus Omnitrophota bacterium]